MVASQSQKPDSQEVSIALTGGRQVSGLHRRAGDGGACCVLAHGAGAGMRHRFLEEIAGGLAQRRLDSLRYQFLYMEQNSKRPDPPKVAHEAVRAAVAQAALLAPGRPLFAGGKSFGGRMTSQAQALQPLPGVLGLVFLGFPLHPPGKPSSERAEHLTQVELPMLFLQGDRDEFASLPLLESVVAQLKPRATLKLFPDADHSFHVRARSGRTDWQIMEEMLNQIASWTTQVISGWAG